jgi:hypothetical protein
LSAVQASKDAPSVKGLKLDLTHEVLVLVCYSAVLGFVPRVPCVDLNGNEWKGNSSL